MFGGIVEAIGRITTVVFEHEARHFIIECGQGFKKWTLGASLAVNGVCLTITAFTAHTISVTAVSETLRVTNLSELVVGSLVNLERPLKLNSRLDGHYVQGHVDAVGEIIAYTRDESGTALLTIQAPAIVLSQVVPKGYIGLDGMSITIIDVLPESLTLTLIPHTQAVTIAGHYTVGTRVNLEVDILGKYVQKMMLRSLVCQP